MPNDALRSVGRIQVGQDEPVRCLAWSSDGRRLATVSDSLLIFDVDRPDAPPYMPETVENVLPGVSVAWRPKSPIVACGSISLVNVDTGMTRSTTPEEYAGHLCWSPDGASLSVGFRLTAKVYDLGDDLVLRERYSLTPQEFAATPAWSPDGMCIAGPSDDGVLVWRAADGEVVGLVSAGTSSLPFGWVRWSPDGRSLAYSTDTRIVVADASSLQEQIVIEAHESWVPHVVWSSCGRLLASISWDATVRIWSTADWSQVAELPVGADDINHTNWLGIDFHPSKPVLAVVSDPTTTVDLWEIDVRHVSRADTRKYTTAKVVLVGDSGVGKTGLAYRLAMGDFREHPSTHGQHFWVADALKTVRGDGTECEVVLWDLAGQVDYRLIHVLFLDDADAAIILFDATRGARALDSVEFWLHALRAGRNDICPAVLVAGRADRGDGDADHAEMDAYVNSRGIDGGLISTSALSGSGLDELTDRLREMIDWDSMSATITTSTFRTIREHILELKGATRVEAPIVTAEQLRSVLEASSAPAITDAELWTAIRNLEVHGYVRIIRATDGRRVVLLMPEHLSNVAASLVLEARRNPLGLGAVDERQALAGGYELAEVQGLSAHNRQLLIESAIVVLLEHNVCFRESLGGSQLLVFPELINEKPPQLAAAEDIVTGVTYVVEGNIQNVYASLVVLLGYTNALTRVNQWQDRAEYEIDDDRVGFTHQRVRDDRFELTLYHQRAASDSKLRLFQGLIERFLQRRRGISVRLYPRVTCECGFSLASEQVIAFIDKGKGFTFCPESGDRIDLPTQAEAVMLTASEQAAVVDQTRAAVQRTELTVALAQLRQFIDANETRATCFVSYDWGDLAHEGWVRGTFVPDLEAAGLEVIFDRNMTQAGDDLARFVSRISGSDYVIVVGTPHYLEKYENRDLHAGSTVAAEADLYSQRLTGSEREKRTVVPVVRSGDRTTALPPLLRGKIAIDLTSDAVYFRNVYDLILRLWQIDVTDPAVKDVRAALVDPRKGPVEQALAMTPAQK